MCNPLGAAFEQGAWVNRLEFTGCESRIAFGEPVKETVNTAAPVVVIGVEISGKCWEISA